MAAEKLRPAYLQKLRGVRTRSEAPYPEWRESVICGLGGALAIAILYALAVDLKLVACFLVPFGATCALVFGLPTAPVCQPRNILGGHVLSALVGVTVVVLFRQATWWTLALAIGLAMGLMTATRTYHPPAAVTVLLPILQKITAVTWVLAPVGLGAMILIVIALLYNNLFAERHYPTFWW